MKTPRNRMTVPLMTRTGSVGLLLALALAAPQGAFAQTLESFPATVFADTFRFPGTWPEGDPDDMFAVRALDAPYVHQGRRPAVRGTYPAIPLDLPLPVSVAELTFGTGPVPPDVFSVEGGMPPHAGRAAAVRPVDLARPAPASEPAPPPEEAVTDAAPASPEPVPAPPPEPAYVAFSTSDVTTGTFAQMRTAAMAAASRDESDVTARLDLARVLLGGMFLQESRHEIDRLSGADLTEAQARYLEDLDRAVSSVDMARVRVFETPATNPLWGTLLDVRNATPVDADRIAAAAAQLSGQSSWIAGAATPVLFEAALKVRNADLAQALLDAAVEAQLLDPSETGLLRGRLAEARGDEEAAFDHYAGAMRTFDTSGIRARIAFADIVLSRNLPASLPGVRDVLSEGVSAWRNDDYARRLMARLAGVTEEIGDTTGALHVMSRLAAEFPGTPEADLAEIRIEVLLGVLADKGREGKIDIETYMRTIRDLAWRIEGSDAWFSARMVLAEKLATAGLHRAAAAEYAAIHADIERANSGGGALVETVLVREARSRIALGDAAGARSLLQAPFRTPGGAVAAERDAVLAQADKLLAGGGFAEDPPTETDADLDIARRAHLMGDDALALRHYNIFTGRGKKLPREDSSRYTLSGARLESDVPSAMAGAADVIQEDNAGAIVEAGRTLREGEIDIVRLSTQNASDLLGRASRTMDAAKSILGRTPTVSDTAEDNPA